MVLPAYAGLVRASAAEIWSLEELWRQKTGSEFDEGLYQAPGPREEMELDLLVVFSVGFFYYLCLKTVYMPVSCKRLIG